ncbi:MAG: carboxypeptidase-like regulatory domain-containing protein [Ignavibacteriales bacterium]|nr:carboxypeptidase-like regulatory domain-containing protein [Ignavibacteriales bacterium]
MKSIAVFIGCLYFFIQPLFAQNVFSVRGVVSDSSTGEPLAAANIRLLGTSKGTITNLQGNYILSLESGNHTLVFSYLAYQPETLIINFSESVTRHILLKPSPIQMSEVLVIAEDPAIDIIRKAIANKRKWMDKLKSYKFEAFSRQVLRRDTSIASITESYSTGYMLIGDTLREVVKQKRQTENIPGTENFAAVHRIINFNDDEINLFNMVVNQKSSSFSFVGPTAPDALEYYDYKLIGTTVMNHVDVYKIQMIPKSRLRPLFKGIIMIAEGTYAVVSVDVKPNETFTFPFIKDIDLSYKQQFALYDSIFWMPIDNRIVGGLSLGIIGISMPRIGIEATSSIYDYAVNIEIPDTILHKPKLIVDSNATKFDSTFWAQNEILPLTDEEQTAYNKLDSSQTLEKQFKPTGPLATLSGEGTNVLFNNVDVRFNRVEGFFFGGNYQIDSVMKYLSLEGSAGYGFSDNRFKYQLGVGIFPLANRKIKIGADVYSRLDNVPDEGYYSPFAISLMALIDKNDYRDYYLAKGWRSYISYDPIRKLSGTISFIGEKEFSMHNTANRGLFSNQKPFRTNPPITEGKLNSVNIDFRFGDREAPLDIVPRDAIEFGYEYSSENLFNSDFNFSRLYTTLNYSFGTFAQSLLLSPVLKVRVSSGLSTGTLPPQRMFVPDSRSSGYAPFGVLKGGGVKEFYGDKFVMINLEHNFRSTPFLALNIPFLYRNGIELILNGSFAQTWVGKTSSSHGWYSEAGIGISRIFDIIRTDFTYRFNDPQRFYFTLSVASIF